MSITRLLNVLSLLISRLLVAFKRLTSWSDALPTSGKIRIESAPFHVDDKALIAEDSNMIDADHATALQVIEKYIYLHNRLYLALSDKAPAPSVSKQISGLHYYVVPFYESHVTEIIHREAEQLPSNEFYFGVPRLKDIFEFDQMACALERKDPATKIVYQAGSDWVSQSTLSFLIGCHMMISHGLGFEETYLAFGSIRSLLEPSSLLRDTSRISVKSCLRAFCRAKCSDWITFKEQNEDLPEKPGTIHIDEYLHYAR
jgi:hypothetical protein